MKEGLFTVEKRLCKYFGPPQKFPEGIRIERGNKVIGLHINNKRLSEVFNGNPISKEKIHKILIASLKELAIFSLKDKRDFVAFCGRTSIRFFSAKKYGFSVTPIDGKRSNLKASLQSFYLRKTHTFPKRRFYQYLIPREILEKRFG